jgi:hypothetical protein
MWDMEIPPSGQNFESLTQNFDPRVEFPYPT